MFDQMTLAIQDETVRRVYIAQVRRNRLERRPVAQALRESREDPAMAAAQQTTGKVDRVAENEAEKPKRMPIVKGKKIGRNEPCPCGFLRPEVQKLPRQERRHHLYAGRRRKLNE